MTKLKLTDIGDEKPVRLTIELPASVHQDLVRYGAVIGGGNGAAVPPVRLITPMLQRFMATDRAFSRAKRCGS